MVRAVTDPEENLPSRRNAGESAIGPIDHRLRDGRVAEERGPQLSLRGERVGAEGARDDRGQVLVRARARAIRLDPNRVGSRPALLAAYYRARPSARARAQRAGVVGKEQVPKSPKGEARGG